MRLPRWLFVAAVAMLCASCTTMPRADVTADDTALAEVAGYPNVRVWGDGTFADFESSGLAPKRQPGKTVRLLAISGGGSSGAYGAGLLVGWSATGKRPAFDIVSGVSTGALMAPFAFLGPAYDDELTYVYTSGVTKNVATMKWLPAGLFGSSLFEQGPLRKLVERFADRKMLDAIAAEDRKGRRLVVVTTNMYAQRPVVWNMGKIAASKDPGAVKLFADVLIASASIPAVYPPVFIDAQADGKQIREMHSDGGSAIQVFAVPDGVLAAASPKSLPDVRRAELYMIVNNTLFPEFEVVDDSTLAIGGRGLATLLKAQTRNSVIATYGFARRFGIKFNLSTIDRSVPYDPTDPFNPEYMRTLYKFGYERALSGDAFRSDPETDLSLPRTGLPRPAMHPATLAVGH